jgi:biotin-(acetyl-CoA carboxylase) ligase
VRRLQAVVDRLQAGEFPDLVGQWTARALWLNELVVVEGAERVSGRFMGIDAFGRMRVLTHAGERLIAEGDVRRGPCVVD